MNQQINPGNHPDADQMNTFVEGAATSREREQMLAHLAECGECREVVFLLRSGEEALAIAAEPAVHMWRRWFMPLGLAGAALACGIAALVYLRPHGPATKPAREMATVQAPNPVIGTGRAASLATPESRPLGSGLGPKAVAKSEGLAGGAEGGVFAMKQTTPLAPIASPAAPTLSDGGQLPTATVSRAVAAAPVMSGRNVQPTADSAPANEPLAPTINGRNTGNLAKYGRQTGLRIEHDQGADDGLSTISGRVTDATGAVIGGATLELRDAAGTTREAMTDAEGKFSLAGVKAGDYSLSVMAPGFERAQQAISLKPRDLAMLDSVLKVGSESQTVAVSAESSTLQTSQAEVAQAETAPELPSRLPAAARVANGKRVLAIDAAGTLFLSRNGGRSWKKIKPVWVGKVAQVALADQAPISGADADDVRRKAGPVANASEAFQLTTDTGAVWVSKDGAHWRVH